MTLINKYDLAAKATERRYVQFDVPGYGEVRIRSMNEAERAEIEYQLAYADDDDRQAVAKSFKARLVAASVVDEEGNRLYTDSEHEQIQQYDSRLVTAIYEQIDQLNGTSTLEDDAKKNSAAANGRQPIDSQPVLAE